jgi:hypothetical protein
VGVQIVAIVELAASIERWSRNRYGVMDDSLSESGVQYGDGP